jgi:integrase
MATDAKLRSPTARATLKANKRHWRTIDKGLALGYWRGTNRSTWIVRRWIEAEKRYELGVLGRTDDKEPADGVVTLDFAQAQKKALAEAGLSAGPLNIADAVSRYVARLTAEKGEHAAEDARQRLALHVTPTLGTRRVVDLSLTGLQNWRDAMLTGKGAVSKATANRVLANFKAALNTVFADDRNGISSDKAWRVLKGFRGANKARQDHFEAEQAQRLIDAARKTSPAFADLLTAGFLTGCRYGELTACDVQHFDAKHGTLAIPSGKTGARPVILTADAIAFFVSIAKGRNATEPLFRKPDGARWGKSEQHRPIKRALEAAKLPRSASFYSLRHSHISRAIEEDVPLFIIARNCGTSEAMIRQHYAKLVAAKERAMLERASKALKLTVVEGRRAA